MILTPEQQEEAKSRPVVVPSNFSADEVNQAYGDRYGTDWVYEEEGEK